MVAFEAKPPKFMGSGSGGSGEMSINKKLLTRRKKSFYNGIQVITIQRINYLSLSILCIVFVILLTESTTPKL